jgi:hypothetical protein
MGKEMEEEGIGRREWIADGLRYTALAGISFFAAAMLVRRAFKPGDSACRIALGCRQCPARAGCRCLELGHRSALPQPPSRRREG